MAAKGSVGGRLFKRVEVIGVESLLWLALGVGTMMIRQSWPLNLTIGLVFSATLVAYPPTSASSSIWRTPESTRRHESQGLLMSNVLIPVLLHIMSFHDDRWNRYARAASIPIHAQYQYFAVFVAFMAYDKALHDFKTWLFLGSWLFLFNSLRFYKSMQGVWTTGEWCIVSCATAIAVSEAVTFRVTTSPSNEYHLVALIGTLGCFLGCGVGSQMGILRIPVLVGTPFIILETALTYHSFRSPKPICLHWIINFLADNENKIQRYMWLPYWGAVLLIMLPLATPPKFAKGLSTVVARKWFHLVAILLFAPVTVLAPQLMTLSYAISLCALMVLECTRPQLPKSIQAMYLQFVDDDKDRPDRVIISHIALIAGCAIPLWLSECTTSDSILLKLWGVMVLGIGDAAAAVVGRTVGKTNWGRRRTLEGSSAMFCSLSLVSFRFEDHWVGAVIFTTLVEAFTSQIDNLVLPLAGATILLLV